MLTPICRLSLCHSLLSFHCCATCSAGLFQLPSGAVLRYKDLGLCHGGAVSGLFLRDSGPEERDVHGCLRHEAIGWWLRSQPVRRRQERCRERRRSSIVARGSWRVTAAHSAVKWIQQRMWAHFSAELWGDCAHKVRCWVPWADYFTSLCLDFLLSKMGTIIAPSPLPGLLWGLNEFIHVEHRETPADLQWMSYKC